MSNDSYTLKVVTECPVLRFFYAYILYNDANIGIKDMYSESFFISVNVAFIMFIGTKCKAVAGLGPSSTNDNNIDSVLHDMRTMSSCDENYVNCVYHLSKAISCIQGMCPRIRDAICMIDENMVNSVFCASTRKAMSSVTLIHPSLIKMMLSVVIDRSRSTSNSDDMYRDTLTRLCVIMSEYLLDRSEFMSFVTFYSSYTFI